MRAAGLLAGQKNYVDAAKPTDPESLRAWREVLRQLVAEPRSGYLHFEKAHTLVLEHNFDCVQCHGPASFMLRERPARQATDAPNGCVIEGSPAILAEKSGIRAD